MTALRVGVAGITGKFARLLTKHLLANPDIHIRGLARNPAKADSSLANHQRVQIAKGEAFDIEALRDFAKGLNVVVCCYLGDNKLMTDGQKLLVDVCEELGVERFVASDWSLDYNKLELGQHPTKDAMKIIKTHLDGKKNIKGVHVLNGAFMEVFLHPFIGLVDYDRRKVQYYGDDSTRFIEATTYDDAAAYTAKIIADPSAVGTKKVLGDRKSPAEFAALLEKAYGGGFETERQGSLSDLYEKLENVRSKDPTNVRAYIGLCYTYYMTNGQTLLWPDLDNDKYPEVKPVTWEDFLRQHPFEELAKSWDSLA